ncbi:MAG TPA: hypothetical protein VN829_21655 [Dongiaceae bacterium]|nr:hypothetical protein [Dongiaceae bacterium]
MNMTKLSPSKVLGLALALVCATLVLGAIYANTDPKPSESKLFHANAGTTFVLLPASTPGGPRSHNIDGVVRVSSLGDCAFHATANLVETATPGSYLITDGRFLFTTADGSSTLTASAAGTLVINPANPYMGDLQYDVTFTGGTGSLAGAHGSGKIHDGMVMFTGIDLVQPDDTTVPPEAAAPPAGSNTGKACWLLDGDLDY